MNDTVKHYIKFSFGPFVSAIIGLIATITFTRIISPENFGASSMYLLVLNISMIISVFGKDQSFMRFFYKEEEDNRILLFIYCIKKPLIVTSILSGAIIVFGRYFTAFLFDSSEIFLVVTLVLGVFFQVLNRFGLVLIRMQQKAILYSIYVIISRSSYLLFGILTYLVLGNTIYTLIIANLIPLLIVAITIFTININTIFKKLGKTGIKSDLNDIKKYGYPFVIIGLIEWVFHSIDKISLSFFVGLYDVGIYSAAFKIVSLLTIVQTTFSTFWIPVAYEKYEASFERSFFVRVFDNVLYAFFLIEIVVITISRYLVHFLGTEYLGAFSSLVILLSIPFIFTISEITSISINLNNKTHSHIYVVIASSVVNIIGNIVLIPLLGAAGAAISTVSSYLVFLVARTLIANSIENFGYGLSRLTVLIAIIISQQFVVILYQEPVIVLVSAVIAIGTGSFVMKGVIKEAFLALSKRQGGL